MLSYTSGTTGDPKGVKMTHKMMLNQTYSGSFILPFEHSDTYISYMPYAHSYEQAVTTLCLYVGCKIGYYSGDPLLLI